MSLDRNEYGYLPNFQLRHRISGEVIQFTRLYNAKQLRKLMGVKKSDWSRFLGRGEVPECDTYVHGKALWTDTTLATVIEQYGEGVPPCR